MTRLILNHDLLSRLGPLDKPLEICDETGHTLGFFKPLPDREQYRNLEPLISEEEMERRRHEDGGRTLQEILRDLEGREK